MTASRHKKPSSTGMQLSLL